MNRREFVASTLTGVIGLAHIPRMAAQGKTAAPDLHALAAANTLKLFNRTASPLVDGARKGVRLAEAPGDGVAFLPGVEFSSGTIEVDIRGKDLPQRSFVGVAFHGVDATTYDGVYFRPFNFKSPNPANSSHGVQYHSLPANTWQKLRAEQPGRYEQAVTPPPDPNAWFHARIVVASPKVSVFVGEAKDPSLVVNTLNDRRTGLVGLWVGNNSGGDFANLVITPA
jgi:hypothetical protein